MVEFFIRKGLIVNQQSTMYTFVVAAEEIELIGSVLKKLPYEQVAPLMVKLQTQINIQNAQRKEPKTEGSTPPANPSENGENEGQN